MTIFHKTSFTHSDSDSVAKKTLAAFLKTSENDIFCNPLTGGSPEATLIKCTYLTTSYVIKLFGTSELGKNEIAWTQHASDLRIGPTFYYANPTGSDMLIEFVKGNSLVPALANTPTIVQNIAVSLKKLHHSFAPFAHTSDMWTRVDTKYEKLHCSGKLKELLEHGLQQVKKIEAQLQSIAMSPAPCHNDLNPGNIFVHDNNVTLIDWGDAALSNPYYDIAAFFVLNVITPETEKLFFEQYDKKLLTPEWQRYMSLYKQQVYFEFALNLLSGVQAAKSELLHSQDIPQGDEISHYLTLLAEQQVKIDSDFLYTMAIASLDKMTFNQ